MFTVNVKRFNFFNFLISNYSLFISITYVIVRKYLYFRLYICLKYAYINHSKKILYKYHYNLTEKKFKILLINIIIIIISINSGLI